MSATCGRELRKMWRIEVRMDSFIVVISKLADAMSRPTRVIKPKDEPDDQS